MTVLQWHVIDGTVDNELAVAAPLGDPDGILDLGRAVREAGWRQLAGWTHQSPTASGWPPPQEVVRVVLPRHEWEFVSATLAKWNALSHSIGQDTALGESTRVLVESALDDPTA